MFVFDEKPASLIGRLVLMVCDGVRPDSRLTLQNLGPCLMFAITISGTSWPEDNENHTAKTQKQRSTNFHQLSRHHP
jgi:hypothetical protein